MEPAVPPHDGHVGDVRRRARRGVAAVAGSALALFWPGAFAFGLPGVLSQHWQQNLGVGRGQEHPRRRGLVSGIVNLVFASAGTIMAPLFVLLLNTLGYRTMSITVGVIASVFGLAIAQVVTLPAPSPWPSHRRWELRFWLRASPTSSFLTSRA